MCETSQSEPKHNRKSVASFVYHKVADKELDIQADR